MMVCFYRNSLLSIFFRSFGDNYCMFLAMETEYSISYSTTGTLGLMLWLTLNNAQACFRSFACCSSLNCSVIKLNSVQGGLE